MYRFIFIDLDDTILDFAAAEHVAYSKTLRALGIEPTEEVLRLYHGINIGWWEKLARGEVERDALLVLRHEQLFAELGVERSGQLCEDTYRRNLGIGHYFIEGAERMLAYLAEKGYELYIASNGVAETQDSRIESAGIGHYFKDIFISERTGYHKPAKAYFDYCFAHIPDFDPTQALLIGDSLSSDIQGGKNAGIATCWYNPKGKEAPEELRPDYEIRSLKEIEDML